MTSSELIWINGSPRGTHVQGAAVSDLLGVILLAAKQH